MGRKQGVTDQKLAELHQFETSPLFSPLEKAALNYATAMTRTPVEVSDEVFAVLKKNFNEKQLVELTACIAWENHRARFDHALGMESEGFSAGAICPLPNPPPF